MLSNSRCYYYNKRVYKFTDIKLTKRTSDYIKSLGPGLVTGAADDDPSGIATYSQIGAKFGVQYIWLALFTLPILISIQNMCGRIGLATRHGIVWHIRKIFPPWVLYVVVIALFIANVFNIAVDLRAMSDAVKLILPHTNSNIGIIIIAIVSLILEIALPYRNYANYLKIMTLSLLAYIICAFISVTDWRSILQALIIPSFDFKLESLILITAVLGTTISPYLFFWQTATEIEEEKAKIQKSHRAIDTTFKSSEFAIMKKDISTGMIASNIIMFFIMVTTGSTLHVNGIVDIETASQASLALKPLAGDFASIVFALGIIGTGLLALPVLAGSAAYAVSEVFGWKEGLNLGIHNGRAFYSIIILAMLVGVLINTFDGGSFKGLIYAALVNAMAVPLILFCIVRISSDGSIMGIFKSTAAQTAVGYISVIIMLLASALSIYYFALF